MFLWYVTSVNLLSGYVLLVCGVNVFGGGDNDDDLERAIALSLSAPPSSCPAAAVPDEPPAHVTSGITRIQVVLPGGTRIRRRFRDHDAVAGLFAFVDSQAKGDRLGDTLVIPRSSVSLSRNSAADLGLTLSGAGRSPSASLRLL